MNKILYMKINTANLLLTGMVSVLIYSSCKKEESYNWRNLEPGKQLISGPDSVKGNDSANYEYLGIPRGGSSYTWTVLRGPVTIKVDTLRNDALHYHPFRVELTANSTIDTSAVIVLQETTWAGKQGESDTFNIQKVFCYIPFNMSDFLGEFRCKEEKIDYFDNSFKSYPLYNVNISYAGGDTFMIDNFSQEQIQIPFVISYDKDEKITIVPTLTDKPLSTTFIGIEKIKGTGSYSMCNKSMKINFAIMDAVLGDTIMTITNYFRKN
jgi:hypothetical protein